MDEAPVKVDGPYRAKLLNSAHGQIDGPAPIVRDATFRTYTEAAYVAILLNAAHQAALNARRAGEGE